MSLKRFRLSRATTVSIYTDNFDVAEILSSGMSVKLIDRMRK
jgi:hypothetical protein